MAEKMIVIHDIDDVWVPWALKVHQKCVEVGLTDKPSWSTWNMSEDYGVPLDSWLDVVHTLSVPNGIYHTPPTEEDLVALQRLADAGHESHFVTARGFFAHADEIRQWTSEWVDALGIPVKLWFAQDKGSVARKIRATHAIDDRFENALSMMEAGVDVYLMNQPHNALIDFDPYRRVNSVADFVERILR